MKHCLLALAAALAAACSTTANPGVCCIGPADCERLDLTEDRPCPAGQACVDFECVVPACTNQGCGPEAPICDADSGACRGCQLDTECPSGACSDDGSCAAEDDVVYLDPMGTDAGSCPRSAPCRTLEFAATKTTLARHHLVLATGHYDLQGGGQVFTVAETPAQRLFVHGGGSMISTTSDGAAIGTQVDLTIQDLEIASSGAGLRINTTGRSRVERVRIRGPNTVGIDVGGDVLMRDILIEDATTAITLGFTARLTLDQGIIKNPGIGVTSTSAMTVVDISNLLVFGATDVAFDLTSSAGGKVAFTTIADSGASAGTGPRAFRCPAAGLGVHASIIWAPGSTARPAIDTGCALSSTIVGPTPVPGATSVDPRFVDAAARDYHLSPASPALDMVDTGPPLDFERDPRPRGPRQRYDIGADEAP